MNDEEIRIDATGDDDTVIVSLPVVRRGRRQLLVGGLVAGAAAVVAACSSDSTSKGPSTTGQAVVTGSSTASPSSAAPSSGTPTTGGGSPSTSGGGGTDDTSASGGNKPDPDPQVRPGDVEGGRDPNNPTAKALSTKLVSDLPTAAFAASLEALAVSTYRRTMMAAAAGQLGSVPAATGEFVRTVMGHHVAALDAWNRLLILSGKEEVTDPDPQLKSVVDDAFAGVSGVEGAARLALMLEEIAAATYLAAIPALASPEAVELVASIYPIDMQHAAVLHFVLGEYPVPDVFGTVTQAASPA